MGVKLKKFSLSLKKPKCPACGARIQVSKRQSTLNKGIIIGYCYKREKHDPHITFKFEMVSFLVPKEPDTDAIIQVKQKKSEFQ